MLSRSLSVDSFCAASAAPGLLQPGQGCVSGAAPGVAALFAEFCSLPQVACKWRGLRDGAPGAATGAACLCTLPLPFVASGLRARHCAAAVLKVFSKHVSLSHSPDWAVLCITCRVYAEAGFAPGAAVLYVAMLSFMP